MAERMMRARQLYTVWMGVVNEYNGTAPLFQHPYAFCTREMAEAFANQQVNEGADIANVHPPRPVEPASWPLDDEIPF